MTSSDLSPAPNRWLQLLAACLTAVLIPLCFTGPAVVLPSISQALGGTPVQLNWILNGYILAYGSVIMVSGSLTDLYGPRRVWLGGLAWFCAFTFPVAWAPSAGWIDFLRLMQGVGGAAAFAAAMSSLAPLFHGAARARAFSLLGTTFGIGLSFGPLISGWLVQTAGWRWVFHGTGLVGLIGLAAPLLVVPFLAALLTRWASPGALSSAGLVAVAAGLAWLARDLSGGADALWLPMGLIGIGIGLPWGLMDAMAVSVVERDRVGMATGIFNTVRVSADGVAIAVVCALLATLIHAQAASALPGADTLALLQAANRAALGQLAEAAQVLPGAGTLLHQAYDTAFGHVLYVLAGIALLLAVLVYALLGRPRTTAVAAVRTQAS